MAPPIFKLVAAAVVVVVDGVELLSNHSRASTGSPCCVCYDAAFPEGRAASPWLIGGGCKPCAHVDLDIFGINKCEIPPLQRVVAEKYNKKCGEEKMSVGVATFADRDPKSIVLPTHGEHAEQLLLNPAFPERTELLGVKCKDGFKEIGQIVREPESFEEACAREDAGSIEADMEAALKEAALEEAALEKAALAEAAAAEKKAAAAEKKYKTKTGKMTGSIPKRTPAKNKAAPAEKNYTTQAEVRERYRLRLRLLEAEVRERYGLRLRLSEVSRRVALWADLCAIEALSMYENSDCGKVSLGFEDIKKMWCPGRHQELMEKQEALQREYSALEAKVDALKRAELDDED